MWKFVKNTLTLYFGNFFQKSQTRRITCQFEGLELQFMFNVSIQPYNSYNESYNTINEVLLTEIIYGVVFDLGPLYWIYWTSISDLLDLGIYL